MAVVLVGGGPDTVTDRSVVAPFVASLTDRDHRPQVAYVLFDRDGSAEAFLPEYRDLLSGVEHDVLRVWAGPDTLIRSDDFARIDAVVVAGGPTPGYHASLQPAFGAIRQLLRDGGSYLGFSAGAMIAPERAILGGRRWQGVDVCPAEWDEGLDDVTLADGIGLYPHPVHVHVGQAGTLGVLVALAQSDASPMLLGLDEGTAVVREDGDGAAWKYCGSGAVWTVEGAAGSVSVQRRPL